MTKDNALTLALEALGRYQVKRQDFERFADVIAAIKEALAQPQEANNFCPRCGKHTPDPAAIHTCTPPRGPVRVPINPNNHEDAPYVHNA